jgi:hypothetical protein
MPRFLGCKENEPAAKRRKKRQMFNRRCTAGPASRDYPVLLKKPARCETRHLKWLKQSSRNSGFFCAARLLEMANNKYLFIQTSKT